MKKFTALLLAICILLTLGACGKKAKEETPNDFDDFSVVEDSFDLEEEDVSSKQETTTSSKNETTSKNPSSKPSKPVEHQIQNNLTIAKGTEPLEKKLNIRGKEITFGSGQPNDELARLMRAFENKYGCKIKLVNIEFDQYTQQVSARIASGKSIDIISMHGSKFPSAVIANLFAPLQSGMTTADLLDESKKAAGGIDYERSKFFAWNNNLYAVTTRTGYDAATSGAIWYNKKILQAAGCKDPRELYEKGQWNWDEMKKIGKAVTNVDKGVYLGKAQLLLFSMVTANGGTYVNFKDGAASENLTDPKIYNALKYMQDMTSGKDKVINVDDYSSDAQSFFEGKIAFYNAAKYNYSSNFNIAEGVSNSNEFGKSLNNLGIVPFPDGPDKKAGDSTEEPWASGWTATIGTSDIRIALAWTKFVSTYKDPVKPKYQLSAKDEALFAKMTDSIKNFKMYGFADSTANVNEHIRKLEESVAYGGDVSQNISDYRKIIGNCIKVTVAQQK